MSRLEDLVGMRIIEVDREKGHLTCQDIRSALSDGIDSPEETGRIRSMLERLNIEVQVSDREYPQKPEHT